MPKKAPLIKGKFNFGIGTRARFKKSTKSWKEYVNHEVLIIEIDSDRSFGIMVLKKGKNIPLYIEESCPVINEVAWVDEKELEFIDNNLVENISFITWYNEHQDYFCPDCGEWMGERGLATDNCLNKKCPSHEY